MQSPKVWGGSSPPRVDYSQNGHWVCGNPKHRVLCTQNMQCPQSPFTHSPCSHHGQASCSAPWPWVRKWERGDGGGAVFLLPTHNGQPLPALSDNKKRCRIQSSACQADKQNSQAPRLANQRCKCTCIADHIGLGVVGSSPPTHPPIHPTPPPSHPPTPRRVQSQCVLGMWQSYTQSPVHTEHAMPPIPIHPFPHVLTMGRPAAQHPGHG